MSVVIVMVVVAIRTTDVIGMFVLEKEGIIVQRPLQVEGAAIEDAGKVNTGTLRAVDAGRGIDVADGLSHGSVNGKGQIRLMCSRNYQLPSRPNVARTRRLVRCHR